MKSPNRDYYYSEPYLLRTVRSKSHERRETYLGDWTDSSASQTRNAI